MQYRLVQVVGTKLVIALPSKMVQVHMHKCSSALIRIGVSSGSTRSSKDNKHVWILFARLSSGCRLATTFVRSLFAGSARLAFFAANLVVLFGQQLYFIWRLELVLFNCTSMNLVVVSLLAPKLFAIVSATNSQQSNILAITLPNTWNRFNNWQFYYKLKFVTKHSQHDSG